MSHLSRGITVKEDYMLTRMTLNLFTGIAQIMADGRMGDLHACPAREIKEFGRICLAMLEGKDIMFSHPGNKGNI